MMAALWSGGARPSRTSSSHSLMTRKKKMSRKDRKRIRSNEDQPVVVAMFADSEIRTYSHSTIDEIGGGSTSEPTDGGCYVQMDSQDSPEHPLKDIFSAARCEQQQQAATRQNRSNVHQGSIPADLVRLVSHWELASSDPLTFHEEVWDIVSPNQIPMIFIEFRKKLDVMDNQWRILGAVSNCCNHESGGDGGNTLRLSRSVSDDVSLMPACSLHGKQHAKSYRFEDGALLDELENIYYSIDIPRAVFLYHRFDLLYRIAKGIKHVPSVWDAAKLALIHVLRCESMRSFLQHVRTLREFSKIGGVGCGADGVNTLFRSISGGSVGSLPSSPQVEAGNSPSVSDMRLCIQSWHGLVLNESMINKVYLQKEPSAAIARLSNYIGCAVDGQ